MTNTVIINGHTYTDDSAPLTGLANGGHRTRFIPALSDVVVVAGQVAANAEAAAAFAASAVSSPGTSATSTTSATIASGSQAIIIQTGKSLVVGAWVICADTAAPGINWMAGPITAYNSTTGDLAFTAKIFDGSGTKNAWTISLSAPGGATLGFNTFSGAQNFAKATVASHAVSADIWGAAGNQIDWTGTATTTAFPDAPNAGAERVLICAGACSFVAGSNLLIDGVASGKTYLCSPGDSVMVRATSVNTFKLTVSSYLAAGAGIPLTASGAIASAGLSVSLNVDGTVSVISETVGAVATGVTISTTSTSNLSAACYVPTLNIVVAFYVSTSTYIRARIGTISGTTITFGAELTPTSVNVIVNYGLSCGYDPSTGYIHFAGQMGANPLYLNWCSVTATTLIFVGAVTATSNAGYGHVSRYVHHAGIGRMLYMWATNTNVYWGMVDTATPAWTLFAAYSVTTGNQKCDIAYDAVNSRVFTAYMPNGQTYIRVTGHTIDPSTYALTTGTVNNTLSDATGLTGSVGLCYDTLNDRLVCFYGATLGAFNAVVGSVDASLRM